jgi:predicted MFS family arabinose efflux permease
VLFGALLAAWVWTLGPPPGAQEALATPLSALRDRRMLAGMWLTLLPAAAFGVLDVLAPLRLDALGASGLVIGATFFLAAGVEALLTPLIGRFTDRRGAIALVRVGLLSSVVVLVLIELPGSVTGLAVAVVVATGVLGLLWVPAMGLLSGGAEHIGLEQGYAFAYFNLAWAGGFALGAAAGGGLAEATADAVPYGIAAVLYAASAVVVLAARRRADALLSRPAQP